MKSGNGNEQARESIRGKQGPLWRDARVSVCFSNVAPGGVRCPIATIEQERSFGVK